MKTPAPIPAHLAVYDWYAPHLAWLRANGYEPRHDPGDAKAKRANLRGADLRGVDLGEADLREADLCVANLRGANLRVANLRGADLGEADLCGADLRWADLSGVNLRGTDLRGVNLRGADLSGVNLREADLRGVNLCGTDLRWVDLSGANLRGADLRGVNLDRAELSGADLLRVNLGGDIPIVPDLDRKILEAVGADGGRLDMGAWHSDCGTTHCRAGWAIKLAGKVGRELEDRLGPCAAGALIYAASVPGRPVPNFHAPQAEALADIRRCAGDAGGAR